MPLKLFGLTGGIACGKTTVAGFLAQRGLPIIDADLVARQVVEPGSKALAEIVAVFGPEVVDGTGVLNRKKLASMVFSDSEARIKLEAITHPRIRQRTAKLARDLANDGHALAAYEAALLVETGASEMFRPLVVVAAPHEEQVRRLMQRDNLSEREAHSRLAAQMPVAGKVKLADHVINTTGSVEQVRCATHTVLKAICVNLNVAPVRYGLE